MGERNFLQNGVKGVLVLLWRNKFSIIGYALLLFLVYVAIYTFFNWDEMVEAFMSGWNSV